jgi:hypothetical protein
MTLMTPEHSQQLDWERRELPLEDGPELRAALQEANVPTLLMVYVHLTHDETMLDVFSNYIKPPYSNPGTQIPDEYLEELRGKLLHVLITPGAAKTGEPSDALMQRMMSVGVGEPVADEFLPLLFDQIGFRLPAPRKALPERKSPPADFQVLVIGGPHRPGGRHQARGSRLRLCGDREEPGGRRHLVGEPLSGRRGRHPQPLLFLLVRDQPGVEPLPPAGQGHAEVPGPRRGQVRAAQEHPLQHHCDQARL